MKIALVALPSSEDNQTNAVAPPLPLGYIAAILEQQRHILRIYDLALSPGAPIADTLAPLHVFNPHLVVVASDSSTVNHELALAFAEFQASVLWLGDSLRDHIPNQQRVQTLRVQTLNDHQKNEQNVIFEALLTLAEELDAAPFPARHLLSLEQYSLKTSDGELQTPILVANPSTSILRKPAQIVAEMQSVIHEHGIRHIVFPGQAITDDIIWLHELLQRLETQKLGVCWEATVDYKHLTPTLLKLFRRAGCESLCFEFDADQVLLSQTERARLSTYVEQVRAFGIRVRARIVLDAPYSAIANLVDVSATFHLDDVQFQVQKSVDTNTDQAHNNQLPVESLTEMLHTRYRSSRSRQFFVERFGPQLGPMLWRVGQFGLMGRIWQKYAKGEGKVIAYNSGQ